MMPAAKSIPVLDIGQLVADPEDPAILKDFASQVSASLSSIGFISLVNHGIDAEIVTEAMEASKTFFELSEEQKETVLSSEEKQQGYVKPGMEIFDQNEDGIKAVQELRESYDMCSISATAVFPDKLVKGARPALTKLAEETRKLGLVLLKCLSLALNQDQNYLRRFHSRILETDNSTKIRSLYYPRLPDRIPPGTVRCGEHSDYGTITLLHQDLLGGLEVRAVDGSWVQATPVPNSVLMNVGDLLEIFSDGLFPATLHRVVIPKEETIRKKSRQSIVLFLHPDYEALVEPLIKHKGTFVPINARQHILKRFSETYPK